MKKLFPVFLILFFFSLPLHADNQGVPEAIRKIENRRGTWLNLRTGLKMNFTSAQGKKASCDADLVYDRLNEKILLKGYNVQKKLLFAFRTDDRDFKLYLSSANTDFFGSIFDLEDSPAIHSHLKALDLYRALKPAAIPADAQIETETGGNIRLKVMGKHGLEREIFANAAGDVVTEVYYRKDGNIKSVIERKDFKPVMKGKKESFYFPGKVLVRNYFSPPGTPGGQSETELLFVTAEFSESFGPLDFDFKLPENTRSADMSEEFKKQQALAD